MLTCKFHFILYFYLPLKSCNFNYSNLLSLINNSFNIRHCNRQPWYLLKLTIYIKAKCLCEVIFFCIALVTYFIGHSPHLCWGLSLLLNFLKGGLKGSQFLVGVAGKEWGEFFRGGRFQFLHKKLKSGIFNDKRSL